jgi:hypothetical protein
MDKIYKQIWMEAKPRYLKGRPMDIDHIKWMMKTADLICKKEKIDAGLLIPLSILHDIGYSEVNKDNYFKLDTRKAHMKAGSKIAKEILINLHYPKSKVKKIVKYISIHDNWAFGKNKEYLNDKVLGTFNDMDYGWTATRKGFKAIMKHLNYKPNDMYNWLLENEKPKDRPFSTRTAQELYNKFLEDRKREYKL